jgi:hypothetical protein
MSRLLIGPAMIRCTDRPCRARAAMGVLALLIAAACSSVQRSEPRTATLIIPDRSAFRPGETDVYDILRLEQAREELLGWQP